MASIVWRNDRCKWYAYFYRGDGRKGSTPLVDAPQRKTLSKRERALAQAEAETIADSQAVVTIDDMDLETAARQWLDNAEATCSMRTVERYRTTVKLLVLHISPTRKLIPLHSVSPMHIRSFRDARMKNHAASTVINDLKCLASMFSWIRKQRTPGGSRWMQENPCEDVEHPRRAQRNVVFPTDAEIRDMLSKLEELPTDQHALGLFGAFAGMRRGEIIMLRWEWIDFERGLLYVYGKSKYPRPVPMHPKVRGFLLSIPRSGDMCFPSPYAKTGQMRSPYAAREFNDWLRKQGYAWTHHGLRRWFNDRLRRITTLSDAARRLVVGHEDEATNRLYQNPQAEEARPFVESLAP